MTTWNSLPREVIFVITSKFKIRLDKFNQKFFKKKKLNFYFYIIQIYFQDLQEILELKTRHIKLFHFLILELMPHQIGLRMDIIRSKTKKMNYLGAIPFI